MNYDSPKDIIELLKNRNLVFNKKYGQNFLINPHVKEKLISLLDLKPDDVVWEVGPGIGSMTHFLTKEIKHLKVFEIDYGFINYLKDTYENLNIVEGDVLKTWKVEKTNKPNKIFGNLPYNIAARFIASLIKEDMIPEKMIFTIQKEVGQRAASAPDKKTYSVFSLICQSSCKVKLHGDIGSGSFYPKPEVTSTIIELTPDPKNISDRKLFFVLVDALFRSRRKTIINNLLSSSFAQKLKKEAFVKILEEESIDPSCRAEKLSLDKIIALSNRFTKEEPDLP